MLNVYVVGGEHEQELGRVQTARSQVEGHPKMTLMPNRNRRWEIMVSDVVWLLVPELPAREMWRLDMGIVVGINECRRDRFKIKVVASGNPPEPDVLGSGTVYLSDGDAFFALCDLAEAR